MSDPELDKGKDNSSATSKNNSLPTTPRTVMDSTSDGSVPFNTTDTPIDLESDVTEVSAVQIDKKSPVAKKKGSGQMTFDDFKSVKVVSSKASDSSLRRSTRIRVSTLKKKEDEIINEQKRVHELEEEESKKKKMGPKTKKQKTKKPKVKIKVKMTLKDDDNEKAGNPGCRKILMSSTTPMAIKSKPAKNPKTSSAKTDVKKPVVKPRSQISRDLLNLKATLSRINDKDLYTKNWCAAIPLPSRLSDEDQSNNADIPQIEKPNLNDILKQESSDLLIPLLYAGKIIRIMSFLNKFHTFFNTTELLTLSFQDFENGLNIKESTEDISIIKNCQDKMNYLYYSLLRLLFDNQQKTATFEHFLELRHPYSRYIPLLRKSCFEWGIVKEWRNLEEGGFFTTGIEKVGLFALKPMDRLIILDSLVLYCLSQSSAIHDVIQEINHDKRDLALVDESYYVTRYFLKGSQNTINSFESLCEQVQFHLERKRVNMIKKKRVMKEEFKDQCKVLRECKEIIRNISPNEDKSKMIISLYDKWLVLFEGIILDNPLNDPYNDDLYTLRLLDFFVGRISEIGDFYLPQLHVFQQGNNDFALFKDLISLLKLFEKFDKGEIDSISLFEEFHGTVSNQFKVFFHDRRNIASQLSFKDTYDNTDGVYWYEICNDTKSLQTFIGKLDELISDEGPDNKLSTILKGADMEKTKEEISNLKNYFNKIIRILKEIENSIELSKTMSPSRGRLRSSSKRVVPAVVRETSDIYYSDDYDEAPHELLGGPIDEDYDVLGEEENMSEYEEENEANITKEEKKVKDDLKSNIIAFNEETVPSKGRSRRSLRNK